MKPKVSLNPHIAPDPVAIEIRRIGASIEQNDLPKAEARALKLLQAHPKRADVHNILGVAYVQQDKKTLAVPHFEFAVKAEPRNSHYLNNLGRLYLDLQFVELALPFLHNALRINPKLASALQAIGKYYNRIGKAEMALPYLERLSKILPQDSVVKMQLAESFDALGRKEEASKLYGEVRQAKPNLVQALYYFSRNPPPEGSTAIIAEIEGLLSREDLTGEQRSTLHTSLGFIHEKGRNYPLSFAHFDQAHQLMPRDFDIGKFRTWVDRVIGVFTESFFRQRGKIGSPSSLPVLVVGMPRSGTTLTEQVIASHGEAGGAGELARIGLFSKKLCLGPKQDTHRFVPILDVTGRQGNA